jgi:hypothetical protein
MNNIPSSTHLDEQWFGRYSTTAFEDYEKFTGHKYTRIKEKRLFLSGFTDCPKLDYPELENFNFSEREKSLTSLYSDIVEKESNTTVRNLYLAKISETISAIHMLAATKSGDDLAFQKQANLVYGDLSLDDVHYVIKSVRDKALKKVNNDDDEQSKAAERLLELFPENYEVTGVSKSILPKTPPDKDIIKSAEEAMVEFRASLRQLEIDDWEVLIDATKGSSTFSVSQEHKVILIPATSKIQKRRMSRRKLRGLIAHEVGTHVARRYHGERSKLRLLGLGLDRYINGDEGIATYSEQCITGAREFAGIARYLSILVAQGGRFGVPKDFKQTFSVMCDYRVLSKKKSLTRDYRVKSLAYNDCVRIFRGTTGKTPGVVYPKDASYFSNRSIWNLVSHYPKAPTTFGLGKFNPNNKGHVRALVELGMIDKGILPE